MSNKQDLSAAKSAAYLTWTQVLPDAPLLVSLQVESFDGFRAYGTDLSIGLYDGVWVVAHVHAKGAGVSVAHGPFDFYEQAVASLISQVAGERAIGFLAAQETGQDQAAVVG
jgi:hypothetical protein